MAWQTIEQRTAIATRRPASMALTIRGEAKLPACTIGFRKVFAATVSWKHGEAVMVQIGEGEHAGLIRILRCKKGQNGIARLRVMKTGGMGFDFGHIPQLGLDAHDKAPTEARLIDADTIEVAIPKWDEIDADDEDDETDEADEPAPRPHASPIAAPSKPAVNGGAGTKLHRNGITLDLTIEEESISFGKKTMDLTTRQAAVLAALLRANPSPVGRAFILNNALVDVPAHARDASLDLIVNDLSKALAGIGLGLNSIKGVGLSLTAKAP